MVFIAQQTRLFYYTLGKPKCFWVLGCVNPVIDWSKCLHQWQINKEYLIIFEESLCCCNLKKGIHNVLKGHQYQYTGLKTLKSFYPDRVYSQCNQDNDKGNWSIRLHSRRNVENFVHFLKVIIIIVWIQDCLVRVCLPVTRNVVEEICAVVKLWAQLELFAATEITICDRIHFELLYHPNHYY